MEHNPVATQQETFLRSRRSSLDSSAEEPIQRADLLVAASLGAVVLMAGLASRRHKGAAVIIAFAGAAAIAAARGGRLGHHQAESSGKREGDALANKPKVERSITIGRTADELYERWCDSATLPQVMSDFVTVRSSDTGRLHWQVNGPLGRVYEWDSQMVDDRPGEGIGWRSLDGAAVRNEGSIRFSPAPADRGTVATLRFRFDPPGGVLGDAAVRLLGTTPLHLVADGVLRRFKSLVETGEIPTTERQPAARGNTR